MKRAWPHLLILSLCLFLSLPIVADANSVPEAARANGFIAMAPSPMNWNDAVAWCKQQGGRLPRINNSDSLADNNIWDSAANKFLPDTRIDGFGKPGRPWSEVGLATAIYWTGTVRSGIQGGLWIVNGINGRLVDINASHQSFDFRVVCVP